MPNVSMPDVPYSRYIEIVEFITQKVQSEPEDGVGVPGKRLRQFYLDQYLDEDRSEDQEYVEGEKQLIVQTIKYMVQESLLKTVALVGGVGFVIHPACKVVPQKDAPVERKMLKDSCHESSPLRSRLADEEDEAWGDQLYQDEEADIHADAYVEMTRLAVPAPSSHRKQDLDTPSRKRRRMEEVAYEISDSNASSRLDSLSPRHSNLSRPSNRVSTAEENRRRSAPSRMDSPAKEHTPRKRPYGEIQSPAVAVKVEKSNSSSAWMVDKCDELREKWPLDRIICEKEDFICLDCDKSMRSLNAQKTRTAQFFESHLRSTGHKNTREARREKQRMGEMMMSTSCQYSTSFATAILPPVQCYSLPSIQTGESSSKGERPLQHIRSVIMQSLDEAEKNAISQIELVQRLENEATRSQLQNQQKFQEIKEAFEESEKSREQQLQEIDLKLSMSTSRDSIQKAQLEQMTEQLKEVNSKTKDQISRMTVLLKSNEFDSKLQLTRVGEQLTSQEKKSEELQNSLGRFSLSQSKHQEQFEQMMCQIKTLESASEKREEYIHDLESTLQLHSEHLQTLRDSEDELRHSLSTRLEAYSQLNAERVSALEIETEEKARAAKNVNADEITLVRKDVLDQLKQSRKANAAEIQTIGKEFSDQLDAASRANVKEIRCFRDEIAETIQSLEKETAEKISSLEEANTELTTQIEGYNGVFGDLFGELEQMQGKFQELAEYVESTKTREKRKSKLPHARRRKVSVRTSRSTSSASTSFSSVMS